MARQCNRQLRPPGEESRDVGNVARSVPEGIVSSLDTLAPTGRFDRVVKALIYQPDLDGWLAARPNWAAQVMRHTEECIASAFDARDEHALLAIHRSLKSLYDLHVFYHPVASENQYNPFLNVLRQKVEKVWIADERRRSRPLHHSPSLHEWDFARDFRDRVLSHPAADHQIFDFLKEEASKQQMIEYLRRPADHGP
jgi:hypothetical protein